MSSSVVVDGKLTSAVRPAWGPAGEIALVFLVFFVQGAFPVPGANEPHYLSKARHYWQPEWCAGDFFLSTSDAHAVFYWMFGWFARWLPLEATAWCGRLLTWSLLAWAWTRLSWSLVPAPLYAVFSAALLVTLNDRFQMAGEWLIGGVEAKGFAYVLVLLGLESLVRGRWTATWLLLGAASSFHVIVGGWAVVAAMFVWLVSPDRPSVTRTIGPLFGGLLLALPGLVPALALTAHVDPQVVNEANQIYVFERLSHHLVPQRFVPQFIVRHLLLIAALVLLIPLAGQDERWRRLRAFIVAAVGMAAVGMVIAMLVPSAPEVAAALLRYYWFRLSDVMVPVGVSLAVASILQRWQQTRHPWHTLALAAALGAVTLHLGELVWLRHKSSLPQADLRIPTFASWDDDSHAMNVDVEASLLADWRRMCQWAADETPSDAVFLTPRLAHTFRWYSGRGEAISRKDLPQDAPSIVEWWRRLQRLHLAAAGTPQARWRRSLAELTPDELRQIGRDLGAQYVITAASPPLALPRVGPRSPNFAIYRLEQK